MGAEVVPAAPDIEEDCTSGDGGDYSDEVGAAEETGGSIAVSSHAIFESEKRMNSESEHIAMRTDLLQ